MLWECIWLIIEWNGILLHVARSCIWVFNFFICTTVFNQMIISGFTNVLVSNVFFHQAKYSNIMVICLTMCYFSWGVSIDHCTDFHVSYHCILNFLVPFFEHTHKYIILLLQYKGRELNKLRAYSMVGTSWDTASLYHSLFNQAKEIANYCMELY